MAYKRGTPAQMASKRGTPAQMAKTAEAIRRILEQDPENFESVYGTHESTGLPPWVTPVVTHGGFPNPNDPAAKLCKGHRLPSFEEIIEMLETGNYQIDHAEHGALLAVVALTHSGYVEEATEILEAIQPWTDYIRFFPTATERPPPLPSEEYAPSSPEEAACHLQSLLDKLTSIPPASYETLDSFGQRTFYQPDGPRDLRTMLLKLFTDKLTVAKFKLQADECVKLYTKLTSVTAGCTKCIACTGITRNDAIGDTKLCGEHKRVTINPCSVCERPADKTVYHSENTYETHKEVVIEARNATQCFDELVGLEALPPWLEKFVKPYRDKALSPEEVKTEFAKLLKKIGWPPNYTYKVTPKLRVFIPKKHGTVRDLCNEHAIEERVVQIYNMRTLTNAKSHGTIVRLMPIVKQINIKIEELQDMKRIMDKIKTRQKEDCEFDLKSFVEAKRELDGEFDLESFVEAKRKLYDEFDLELDGEFDLESFVGAKRELFVRTTVTNAIKKYGLPGTSKYKKCNEPFERVLQRTADKIKYLEDLIHRLKASGPSPVGVPAKVMATILGDLEKSPFYKGEVQTILDRAILKPIRERATSPQLLAELCTPLMTMVAVGMPRDGEPPFLRTILQRMMQAFMKRRSIMLLNTQGQVRASDVPFIAVLQRVLKVNEHSKESRLDGLKWLMTTYLDIFPHYMVPNEILRLVRECKHDIPVLEEIAADIFQGHLVPKFGVVCKLAADLLGPDSVYGQYYGDNLLQLWTRPAITSADLVEWAGRGLEHVHPYTVKHGMQLELVRVATCSNMVLASSVVSDDFLFRLGLGFDWYAASLKTWKFIVRLGTTERFPCLLRSDIRQLVQAWNLLLFYLSRYMIALQQQQIAAKGFNDVADDLVLHRFSTDMRSVLQKTPLVSELDEKLLIDFFVTPIEAIAEKGAWDGPPVFGWFTAHVPLDSCSVIAALRSVTPS